MKSIIPLLLLILFPALVAVAQEADEGFKPSATVTVDERIHDFGEFKEADGIVTHKFRLTNNGKEPAVIVRAKYGCTCISVDYPRKPIMPGKSAEITVTYNPYYRPGHFSKEIALVFADRSYRKIWVKGDVLPMQHPVSENNPYGYGDGIWMNLGKVVLGHLQPGGEKSMKLRLANDNDYPVELSFSMPRDAAIDLRLPPRITIRPKEETTVRISAVGHMAFSGIRSTKLTVLVNGKPLKQQLEVTAHGTLNEL